MKSKLSMLLSALLLTAMVLSACATPGAQPAAQPAASGEQAAASAGAVNLQLMGWASSDAENVRLQEVVDGWNAANPDIQVSLNLVPDYDTKLQTSLAGGAPPDIFYVDSFRLPDLAAANALLPIGDKMTNVDDFYPSLREAFTVGGTFYCPPKDFSTLALEYNTDLFDAAGLAYPTADWTWDDLRAAAEKLTNKDTGVVGFSINPDFARWIAFLYQAGGEVTTPDFSAMTLNTPEALTAMEFYVGLVRDGFAAPASDLDSGWPGEAFGKGRAAMTMEGNWIVPFLKDQFPDLKYGITELPAGPAGKATMAFTVCYGVAANGKHTDAATKVVDYLTGPEGMKAWTDLGLAMPTRQSLREGWLAQYPNLEPFLNGADYAHKWQFRPG
ncbi:MAG TPA: ABC transporter substrate-binding protein, partial [Chloroflexi bacterium]|nr:ABC transporter substrate-binding protein [Chloroflexota bacterium]